MGTGEGFLASFGGWPPVGEMDGWLDFGGSASGGPKGALNQAEAPGTLAEPGRRSARVLKFRGLDRFDPDWWQARPEPSPTLFQ